MLDEEYDVEGWTENEDCGCLISAQQVDGERVEFHHWIPDDTAPHVPDAECGCGPVLRENPDGVMLFEHFDQDDSGLWPPAESETPS